MLTDHLDWRWCVYVNLPVTALAAAGVLYSVRPAPHVAGVHIDTIGAVLATAGLMALVFGFARAEPDGWDASSSARADRGPDSAVLRRPSKYHERLRVVQPLDGGQVVDVASG
ncbi:hypothetical protein ACIBQ1_27760 [Nonomuraea sp. NPDC050153]|uniref:hypothetical protein n=1 Tax=Nonomuraea sp. NPDC050153 TaxID=3364359 RepID=UPI0037B5011E